MNLTSTSTVAVLCCLAFTAWAPLTAQQLHVAGQASNGQAVQDPAEIYLTAYRLCRESERLAQQQNYNAAISRAKQAEKILAGIVKDYPNWKSNLVSMRRRLLAENMAVYRQKAKEAPIPTGRQPGKPISMEGPRTTLVLHRRSISRLSCRIMTARTRSCTMHWHWLRRNAAVWRLPTRS